MFFPIAAGASVNDSYVLLAPAVYTDTSASNLSERVFQGIPAIERVGSRLWCAWYGDDTLPTSYGEGPGNFCVLAYSDDDGATWAECAYLCPVEGTDRVFDPRLWLAPDGSVWVITAQCGNNSVYDGQYGVWVNRIISPAGSWTIEPGFWLVDGVPGRPFAVGSEWYIQVDYWTGGNGPFAARFQGRTGRHLYKINVAQRSLAYISKGPYGAQTTFDESCGVQLADGRVLAQWRTPTGAWQSVSTDSTATSWGAPAPFTGLTIPNARHQIARSPSGRLVCVFNNNAVASARSHLSVALSNDDGETWPHVTLIDVRERTSYPEITFDAAGNIYVAYDCERTADVGQGRRQIMVAKLSEAAAVAGTATPSIVVVSQFIP